ncbi:MAG TPA: GH116 family glycosyl hydrolase [Pyrinomonadaceae bacterium]|nr:GH116 family glycosyl hydrolase [Pyrinomonadaceae bacterium]
MKDRFILEGLICLILVFTSTAAGNAQGPMDRTLVPKFDLKKSGLELQRRTHAGAFFDVVGHKSAALGYENRSFEAWVYPLKILDDFELSFRIEGYPLEFRGRDIQVQINVRPEATIFTYSHAAFTVRQIIYAPVDEPGVIVLLDVKTVLPMTVLASFHPRLKLAWPAGLMTGNLEWEEKQHVYYLSEETKRFVGIVGSPAARDIAVMPYQEEPRDVPIKFTVEPSQETLKSQFIPIVITGSVEGREKAKATYDRLLASAQALYNKNVVYYERLQNKTTSINTPDHNLNNAFQWAKVGIDKGLANNPFLGTGLVAGFRTSGDSERPGFAWFFGRDALWTSLAINSYGDFETTRTALDFLKKFQRADGKIPHEISQSASLIPWFTDYEFPWNSADGTPLYVIAHGDYWRSSGDQDFLRTHWDSVVKAYRFSAASDTDGNQLIENSTKTKFGHGWVEGGGLYPPHEEIYMQGLWIEASRSMAEMADALGDVGLAGTARANAEHTRAAMEQTYWLPNRGFYAFATKRPPAEPPKADPGPNRALRQARMEELSKAAIIDEDTVMPAVPLWWRTMSDERAQSEIDHLGSGQMATDWGTRIISNESKLYDPLSYHNGSVWPLFTGWTSTAAYAYGRSQVGYQALMANALLTYPSALGYVTELLSGDFNAAFGRSSHHQVWSEAMVVTPTVRGLLGIEVTAGGKQLRFAPRLPVNWDQVEVQSVAVGNRKYDLNLRHVAGRTTIVAKRSGSNASAVPGKVRVTIAPTFPLDARVRSVTVQGRRVKFEVSQTGDAQSAVVSFDLDQQSIEVVFTHDEGTDVYMEPEIPAPGTKSQGLRILRSRADVAGLHLVLEGVGGRLYTLLVRSPHQLLETAGVKVRTNRGANQELSVQFEGPADTYIRREVTIPFRARRK